MMPSPNKPTPPHITLEWVKLRCEDTGDCWLWKQTTAKSGSPTLNWRPDGVKSVTYQVRRVVFALANPKIEIGARFVSPSCGNPRCLHPKHLVLRTKAEVVALTWTMPDTRAKRVRGLERARPNAKLGMNNARYVRESTKPLSELSAELNVGPTVLSRVRRGLSWREPANPFAALIG